MNSTLSTIEVFAQQLKARSTAIQVTESFFMLLINFASFAGNLLLGIAVIKNPNLRRTVPNMYIITLAVSDFLMSTLGISFSAVSLFIGKWPFNNFVCQLQGFWILLMCAVSLQTLAVTAVNRYFRVVRSRALYQKLFNMKTTKVTILIVWVVAFFAPLPYVVFGHEFFFHTGKVFCAHDAESLNHGYGAYLVLVYVFIPLIIIITCYTRVFIAVRKHNMNFSRTRNRSRTESNLSTEGRLSVEEVNVTYVLLAVVIGFLACWTPVMVIDMIDFINADWKLKRQAYVSYTCFGFASTSINPVIYGIMNRAFRAEYMKILAPLKIWSSSQSESGVHVYNSDAVKKSPHSLTLKNKVGVTFEIGHENPAQNKAVESERARQYRANSLSSKREFSNAKFESTQSL